MNSGGWKWLHTINGEFNNEHFRDFCENLNVRIKTASAETDPPKNSF